MGALFVSTAVVAVVVIIVVQKAGFATDRTERVFPPTMLKDILGEKIAYLSTGSTLEL